MPTHSIGRIGFGSKTLNEEVQIGSNIILPAGGPWLIYDIWHQSLITLEDGFISTSGFIHLRSISGDIQPDPSPGQFPVSNHFITFAGAIESDLDFINHSKTRLLAPGKSQISLNHVADKTITPETIYSVGILFDKSIPLSRHSPWSARAAKFVSTNRETLLGTIILSEGSKRITSAYFDLFVPSGMFINESLIAQFRLDSDDIEITPAVFPSFRAYTRLGGGFLNFSIASVQTPIILDIPVLGGSRIDVFVTLFVATSTPVLAQGFLTYE